MKNVPNKASGTLYIQYNYNIYNYICDMNRVGGRHLEKIKWITFIILKGDKSFSIKSRLNFGEQSSHVELQPTNPLLLGIKL